MCGIAGFVNHRTQDPAERRVLESMLQAMLERGPDDGGCYLDRYVGLGHRRLSIVDRSGGHQPMCNEDGRVWITFNGEIYNFQALREELLAQGHTFKTRSDTEVILHLYEDLDAGCVQRLVGMFAFAIWDSRTDSLFLARDRFGIKPLYYAAGPDTFGFSSSIRALLQMPSVASRLNVQAAHDYLTLRYNIAPQTIFQGIAKLEPGHCMTVRRGDVTIRQYWDLDASKKVILPEAELIGEFARRFEHSVVTHLMGEVPHGVLLSGGLDSTAVTAVLAQQLSRPVKTFSVSFHSEDRNPAWDEREYAQLAARTYGTDHHELVLTGKAFADAVAPSVYQMEEPMADPAAVPLYCISELARRHVTVLFSGEGGDELLAGYTFGEAFKGYQRARWVHAIPRAIRHGLLEPINRYLVKSDRLARYLKIANAPLAQYPMIVPSHMTRVLSEDMKQALYSDWMKGHRLRGSEQLIIDAYARTTHCEFLDQMLYVYTKQWLADDLLLKADKMTMAHSLELRVPFLDHPFAEFVASLPTDQKLRREGRQFTTKYIFRRAFEGRIPPTILTREKIGFSVPLHEIFHRELLPMAADLFRSQAFKETGLFQIDKVLAYVDNYEAARQAGQWSHVMALWSLLVFALWNQHYGTGATRSVPGGAYDLMAPER
jgi:asparagine synthase (glutamine-hydrolysing)